MADSWYNIIQDGDKMPTFMNDLDQTKDIAM